MKLYTFPLAPNPTKVEVFLKEKGIELERELVNLLQEILTGLFMYGSKILLGIYLP